jgi:hypothetical protein
VGRLSELAQQALRAHTVDVYVVDPTKGTVRRCRKDADADVKVDAPAGSPGGSDGKSRCGGKGQGEGEGGGESDSGTGSDSDTDCGDKESPSDRGLAAMVARTGITVRSDDIRSTGGYDSEVDCVRDEREDAAGARTWGGGGGWGGAGGQCECNPLAVLAVPIRRGGGSSSDVVAVLVAVGSPTGSVGVGNGAAASDGTPLGFSAEDLYIAQTLAAHAGVFLHNASVYDSGLSAERTGRQVMQRGRELAAQLDMCEVSALLSKATEDLMRAKHTRLLLVDGSGHPLGMRDAGGAETARGSGGGGSDSSRSTSASRGLCGGIVHSNETINTRGSDDVRFFEPTDLPPAAARLGERANVMAAAPVLCGKNTALGVLQVTNRVSKPRRFVSAAAAVVAMHDGGGHHLAPPSPPVTNSLRAPGDSPTPNPTPCIIIPKP